MSTRKIGEAKLSCLSINGSAPAAAADAIKPYTYCLNSDLPVLRMRIDPGSDDLHVYNHIVRFQNRYVAKQVEYAFVGLYGQKSGIRWTAQIDVLETLTPADAKDLDPPAGTLPAIKTVTVPEKDSKPLLLEHPKPVYPPIAKAAHVSGSVVLRATVGADGRITDFVIESGPAMLQQAAIDAVKQWTFKPYMVDGDVAEMETTITVPFILSPFDH
ncbi:MAG: energy transducer TonB [Terracidiphilus sp.]|jgi:TonB family protein